MYKTPFCNIFSISAKHVRHAAQSSKNMQCSLKVIGRGKYTNRIHAINEDAVETVNNSQGLFQGTDHKTVLHVSSQNISSFC